MKKIITIIAVIALMAVLGVILFACVPSDLDKAQKKLEKKGYYVDDLEKYDADDFDDDEIAYVGYIEAYKNNEEVSAYLFKDTATAKKFYEEKKEKFEKNLKERADYLKERKEELDEYKGSEDYAERLREYESYAKYTPEFTMIRKGKWVIDGTEAGIKDFK